jgi:GGDEF domain-containing protein
MREASIDDPDTGLLNSLGMAAELLTLEEQATGYALIQIVLTGHTLPLLTSVARSAAQLIGDRGLVARNGLAMLTAILPSFTGIAAMSLAEQMRAAFVKQSADSFARIGIGVAIKQPGESSRDVLRRVADRAEEATLAAGVTVCG